MINPASIRSFSDELQKIAEILHTDSIDELRKELKPGDILYTKPRKVEGIGNKIFYAIEKRVQKSPYSHVGIYVGDGKIVDAGQWKGGTKVKNPIAVHEVDLPTYTNKYNFKVLRVNAPDEVKQDAVDYAKSQVGKGFNFKGMFRLALPWKGTPEQKDRARKDLAESFFCSELVVNAYSPTNIASKKKFKHVMPGDIFKSPVTRTVAQFDKEAALRALLKNS
jgi:uncharacterized protein YycO